MNDAKLSFAVAKIMWPENVWVDHGSCAAKGHQFYDDDFFNHTTDDALGKMCVWYAKKNCLVSDQHRLIAMLASPNPHRAIAKAIICVD